MMVLRNTFGTKLIQEGRPLSNEISGLKRNPSGFSDKTLEERISNPEGDLPGLRPGTEPLQNSKDEVVCGL